MDNTLKRNELGYYELVNKPTREELQAYFADKYFQELRSSTYQSSYSPTEYMYIYNLIKRNHAVISKYYPNPQNILDVGCGEGYTLSYFKKLGLNVKGIDYSSEGVSSKNPDCLPDLEVGDLNDVVKKEIKSKNKYDIIWLSRVLDHLHDPVCLLKDLYRLVYSEGNQRGILVITVGNNFSIVQKTAKKLGIIDNEFWVCPDHLSYFSYSSIVNTVESTGWKVIEAIADFPHSLNYN